jgi:sugar lactone lactonase YvrE
MMRGGLFLCAVACYAASPTAWELASYSDFVKGRFENVSLSHDGRLMLAPELKPVFESGQPAIWAAVSAKDGTIYAATGHRGRLYRVDRAGKSEVIFTAPEPEIFALALDASGRLYAATSPNGRIYRFTNNKPEEFFDPKAAYIWALAFAGDGSLYAATGNEGKIFRISSNGSGEVYYETGQSHITCLALDAKGTLLAGSEPNGMIYRVAGKDRAFVLFDSDLPEIRSIVPMPDGSVYAAAMGGSLVRQPGSETAAPATVSSTAVTSVSASVTVAEPAQAGVEIKPKPDLQQAQPAAGAAGQPALVEYAGADKSAIYRINSDGTVETMFQSKEENVYDLAPWNGSIYFGTDYQGRIYRLDGRRIGLVVESRESEMLRLAVLDGGLLAATGNLGRLFRLGANSPQGAYESEVHDASSVSRWGKAGLIAGQGVKLRTRTGNSARPDRTWSEWSAPLASGGQITSPNARYLQFKIQLDSMAVVESIRLPYLPQNRPPVLSSVSVSGQAATAPPAAQTPAAAVPYTLTVTDSGQATATASGGTPAQMVSRTTSEQILISWQAQDADSDKLVFKVEARGQQEREWKVLKAGLEGSSHTIDADALADGRYQFRVTASDAPANPAALARETELMSAPVLIDRTPPRIALARTGSSITVDASDGASPLKSAHWSIDAGPWQTLAAEDGITDSLTERFLVTLPPLAAGEHILAVRVLDAAGNPALGKVVLP